MEQFVTFIKKHGALGVLTLWLWYTNDRVEQLEDKLYDCYKEQAIKQGILKQEFKHTQQYAILPDKIKIKCQDLKITETKTA